jgi:hypothetical protein
MSQVQSLDRDDNRGSRVAPSEGAPDKNGDVPVSAEALRPKEDPDTAPNDADDWDYRPRKTPFGLPYDEEFPLLFFVGLVVFAAVAALIMVFAT